MRLRGPKAHAGSGVRSYYAPTMRIGILGATGPAGSGLAARLADAATRCCTARGRSTRRSRASRELNEQWGDRVANLHPCDNAWACDAPVVILAVNADSAIPTVHEHAERLQGKIVVSMANNLVKQRQRVQRGAAAARFGGRRDPGAAVALARVHRVPPRSRGRVRRPRPHDGERRRGARRPGRREGRAHGDHVEHPEPAPARRRFAAQRGRAWRRSRRCC